MAENAKNSPLSLVGDIQFFGYRNFSVKQQSGGGSYSLHFYSAISALLRGQCQGRSWWLQGTIYISDNPTSFVGEVIFSEKFKAMIFKHIKHRMQLSIKRQI